ncbi:MAG: ADP-ribosylglycohydrolase family protein [Candidatus Latescibacterota bacterium]
MPRRKVHTYEEQVYAGVLGKIIGVYLGRPIEGWPKAKIEERFGRIDRYVHEDLGKALVVADDDISGTFTFVRALEDSGLYADTPDEYFGDTWLNYVLENRTIFWWGGVGMSTEHTAFVRLIEGVKSPQSGAIETNGRTVAEQIGAQIFIDAFGMVSPGDPTLAASLARRAGAVGHDGEAVHAAAVTAAMVAAAFVEKDMFKLLDIGVAQIPEDSIIARLHRDVRTWARQDRDWHRTFRRIDRRYGYHKYGGNCHVVPNHALMVLAWAYAPDDFHAAQVIVNTCGWDTDCNAANVGCVMGVQLGLDGIGARYDFRGPVADRLKLPTAEGTWSTTDALTVAHHVARIGRRVMGWQKAPAPKGGAFHHFEMPGAVQGWTAQQAPFATHDNMKVENVKAHSRHGGHSLALHYNAGPGRIARAATPVNPVAETGGYHILGTPRLYTGMRVRVDGLASGVGRARLFVTCTPKDQATIYAYSRSAWMQEGKVVNLSLIVPDTDGLPIDCIGIEVDADEPCAGTLFLDRVRLDGKPQLAWPVSMNAQGNHVPGWILYADRILGSFSDDDEDCRHFSMDRDRGFAATGTLDWTDYAIAARVKIHHARMGGLILRYQGARRYLALVMTGKKLQIIERSDGTDTVLAEKRLTIRLDHFYKLTLTAKGRRIFAGLDRKTVLEAEDTRLGKGGAGLLFDRGIVGFREVKIR